MAVYDPLREYLAAKALDLIPMSFGEIEKVTGRKLPASAYRHRPWWANEAQGHSHAKAWLQAGYETEQVDMAAKKLVFRRARSAETGMSEEPREFKPLKTVERKRGRSPLWGALKGTFTLVPPSDAEPAPEDPESWEALALAKLDRLLFSGDA